MDSFYSDDFGAKRGGKAGDGATEELVSYVAAATQVVGLLNPTL